MFHTFRLHSDIIFARSALLPLSISLPQSDIVMTRSHTPAVQPHLCNEHGVEHWNRFMQPEHQSSLKYVVTVTTSHISTQEFSITISLLRIGLPVSTRNLHQNFYIYIKKAIKKDMNDIMIWMIVGKNLDQLSSIVTSLNIDTPPQTPQSLRERTTSSCHQHKIVLLLHLQVSLILYAIM